MAWGYNAELPNKWGGKMPIVLPAEQPSTTWRWEAFMPRVPFDPVRDLEGPLLEYDRNDGTGGHYIKMVSNIPGSTVWFGWVSEAGRFDVIDITKPRSIVSQIYNGEPLCPPNPTNNGDT